jgi:hypothetical protein
LNAQKSLKRGVDQGSRGYLSPDGSSEMLRDPRGGDLIEPAGAQG